MTREKNASSIAPPWGGRSYLAWMALTCSVLLTVLAWDVTSRSLRDRLREQFVARSEQIAMAIRRRMSEYEGALRGVVALFMASDVVTRADFRRYLRELSLERHYPGLQGVGFARFATPSELDEVIAAVRAEGFSDFSVKPEGVRDHYAPIVLLEPLRGRNLRAFGFDMYSEPKRREAMQRAARTGLPAISGAVTLVQETEQDVQSGFLMYLPLFTGSDRRELRGFIYSPYRTGDLMYGILGDLPSDIDYRLTDDGEVLFDTRAEQPQRSTWGTYKHTSSLQMAGRSWQLEFWSRPSFGESVWHGEPLIVLISGIVINLLLFYIVGSSASLQRRARALAQGMTDELKASHVREQEQILSSLREKETLLREIHHRVKNNLQVVSSMLSLQHSRTADPRAVAPLKESQHRVLAMAALHEFLYQSPDLSRVDTGGYLTHVVRVLIDAYRATGRVSVDLRLADVPLDVDLAIPCGLIVNELVSNALKYAFEEGTRGSLTVSLDERGDGIELVVADDGRGLPADFKLDGETLGIMLVQLLTEQVGGVLEVDRGRGARFVVRFPRERRRAAA